MDEIGPDITEYPYSSNGTLNGTVEVTDTGRYVSISKGNNVTFDQGEGVDGRLVFQGAVVYSTNSTGVLSFLDNTVSIFRGEGDYATGDFTSMEWEWK